MFNLSECRSRTVVFPVTFMYWYAAIERRSCEAIVHDCLRCRELEQSRLPQGRNNCIVDTRLWI